MTRRATFRQTDLARAVRVARKEGARGVLVRPDGAICIDLAEQDAIASYPENAPRPAQKTEIVL